MLLALYPQLSFRLARGHEWNGMHAYAHGDEVVYAAYLNALTDGRPRRSDPYTGRDDAPAAPQAESYFSIQFIPPYALALAARLVGASVPQTFVALTCIAALLSSLAVYWLIASMTGDERVAAAGVLVVLCLGSAHLVVEYVLGFGASNNGLPFLRRYLPSAPFPVFFIFCALVWRMLTTGNRRAAYAQAVLAGLAFATLVYSYFYLWTTAAAWLLCLTLLWLTSRPDLRRGSLKLFAILAALAVAALLPYFALLSQRVVTTDDALLLTPSHAPDLFRVPELVGLVVLAALALSVRGGRIKRRGRDVIFTAAFALTPFVVFNQQIITGRSLQPFHYGMFIVNYTTVLAALLCGVIIHRGETTDATSEATRRIPSIALAALALVALLSGMFEARLSGKRFMAANTLRDEARPAALRLATLARNSNDALSDANAVAGTGRLAMNAPRGMLDTRSLVLVTDYTVADTLPTVAPQPVLWSPHMFNFPGVSLAEDRERLAQYLYFNGIDFSDVDPERFETLDNRRKYLVSALISRSRHNPNLSVNWKPIAPAEVRGALRFYESHVASFDAERAARPLLTYVLTATDERVDFSNLDRWYQRDAGQRLGKFTLYGVKLRPSPPAAQHD